LDATSMLVGVDEYSTYPPEVTRLPKIGSYLTPNLEAIVALRPTLVVVDDVHSQAAGALRDAGVTTVACAIHGLGDVRAALHAVAAKIGRTAEAERASQQIDAALATAAANRPKTRPRVLAIIDREPTGLRNLVAAGPASWVDELLDAVGADNVLAQAAVRYPKISIEEVLRANPDIIFDLSFSARTEVTAWNELDVPAVKTGRVVALTEPFLVAPSPRVKQALEAVRKAIATPAQ
ncbi:MAG: ABC transporter substrate-binding protein, partial [Kofleriaceae bacterium]